MTDIPKNINKLKNILANHFGEPDKFNLDNGEIIYNLDNDNYINIHYYWFGMGVYFVIVSFYKLNIKDGYMMFSRMNDLINYLNKKCNIGMLMIKEPDCE